MSAYKWFLNGVEVAEPAVIGDPWTGAISTATTLDPGAHVIRFESSDNGGSTHNQLNIVVIVGDNTEDNCVILDE